MRTVAAWLAVGAFGVGVVAVGGCGKAQAADEAPALSKPAEQPAAALFSAAPTPGVVPCGKDLTCPATKAARRVCCNAPGVPPMCRSADRCGQATKFRYSGMLSCNETADCKALDPGRDVVCCLTDDGFRADGVAGPYDRAACTPRTACVGSDVIACVSDGECPSGKRCKAVGMGVGIELGGCLP